VGTFVNPQSNASSVNRTSLSIIIPVLNEGEAIAACLHALSPLRARGVQVIVVDGGSQDDSLAQAQALVDLAVVSPRGRARQMNAGASLAQGDVLLFLHADTQLPDAADAMVLAAIAAGAHWGRFDVHIKGQSPMLKVVAGMMNLRSRLSGIATGDQAVFVKRAVFQSVGGFPDQPLMEDIELSKRLGRLAAPACLRERVSTSGRRWESRGVWRTIVLMWCLRWRYWRGESPEQLAQAYR
jgi:rSAM/selenodomain-associated transferase 2